MTSYVKGMGYTPKKTAAEKRSERLIVLLTPAEKQALDDEAEAKEQSVAVVVRRRLRFTPDELEAV